MSVRLRASDPVRAAAAACVVAALLGTIPSPAGAQDSRAELLRAERAEKARQASPYDPGLVEKLAVFAGEKESGGRPLGWYPYVGTVFTGGGFAVGAGYRLPFRDTGEVEIEAAVSYKLYKRIEVEFDLPRMADGRLQVSTRARWLDATKVNYFGIGNDTDVDDLSTFRTTPLTLETRAAYDVTPWLNVGGGLDVVRNDFGRGRTSPSIEELFSPAQAPALGVEPNYLVGRAFAAVDTRPGAGYSTRGGFYRAEVSAFGDRDAGRYSFRRLDAEAVQLVPVLRANWVLAFRGLVSLTDTNAGHEIPYFLLPSLGHARDLRGFENFRFRDRHRLLLSAEYRWTPSRIADMVLFVDRGKVAHDVSDLDLSNLHTGYGIGIRFHTPRHTVLRLEFARSSEANRFIFGVGPNF